MFEGVSVAVIVPAYDEERHLPRVLASVPAWVDEVIVIDDGSRDGTARAAASVGGRVRLIRHRTNRGVGAAVRTGYRAALDAGAGVVAVMAGDAQMDPRELRPLVHAVVAGGADYAKGERLSHPEVGARMPAWRRLGTVVLSRLTAGISGYGFLRDAQCGYTAATAAILRKLPLERMVDRYGYPNDLLMMLADAGARIAEVPVTPIYGDERSGITPWGAVLSHGRVLLRAAWRRA